MKEKLTRTKTDKRYAEVNTIGARRNNFIQTSCRRWVMNNHPAVLRAIEDKAYEKFPIPGGDKRVHRKTVNDYSFIDNIKDTQ